MSAIPEAVRRQALYPFHELPPPNNVELFQLDGAVLGISPIPTAQVATPRSVDLDVATAVAASRAIARAHEKTIIAWWIGPEHDHLAPLFEALGVVNAETPGFEPTENGMALVHPPVGERPEGIDVRTVGSFDDYRACVEVLNECFGTTPQTDDELRDRYDEYVADSSGESFIACDGDRVVAHAYAAFGEAGLNLFGGAVLPDMRGRGVYRALTFARWDEAVERGTPALTVQAGKMSMPILESLGFEFIDQSRVFVDELSS